MNKPIIIFIIHFIVVSIVAFICSLVWFGATTVIMLLYILGLNGVSVYLFRSSVLWIEYKKMDTSIHEKLLQLTGRSATTMGLLLGIIDIIFMVIIGYIIYILYYLFFNEIYAISVALLFVLFEIVSILISIKMLQILLRKYATRGHRD